MRKRISIPKENSVPSVSDVLKGQGIPETVTPDRTTSRLAQQSISAYRDLSRPTGIIMEISKTDFTEVYRGEGKNEEETPLAKISKSSDCLALFAVTVGENIGVKISGLFHENEFALGSMLDSAASVGAELAADVVESHYRSYLKETGRLDSSSAVMRFSPGYCGWDLSAQKRLFEFLRPAEIGVTLRESFLMEPLKSISGVIVAGPKEIFQFDDDFPFCSDCDSHSCRDRIKAIMGQ